MLMWEWCTNGAQIGCDWSLTMVLQEMPQMRGVQELLSWLDHEHKCVACAKQFSLTTSWKQRLDRHINVHQGVRPFACHYCLKAFARKDALKLHITRVHLIHADRSSVLSWCFYGDHAELVMLMPTDRVAGGRVRARASSLRHVPKRWNCWTKNLSYLQKSLLVSYLEAKAW